MVTFDDPWYPQMIERFSTGDPLGDKILAVACIIGTAIDGIANELKSINSTLEELQENGND